MPFSERAAAQRKNAALDQSPSAGTSFGSSGVCGPDIFQVSEKLSEDGGYYYGIARELGVPIKAFTESTILTDYDVVVDCLLGTGFQGTVRGLTRDAISAINRSSAYVISVDINSGMNGDTGEAELAVKSDLTVSIGSYKQGLFKGNAREYINRLVNVDIGIVLV